MRGNVPQKIQILKFVGEQGIVSVGDISRHLFRSDKFRIVRSTLYDLGVAHIRYRNVYGGLWYIDNPKLFELLGTYYPKLPAFEVTPIYDHYILHYLELNRIRSVFEHSRQIIIDEWWSEHYMRALPPALRVKVSNPKIPDAVFWRKKPDGTRQQFFLEYERSLKNKERYEEIFSIYARHPDIQNNNVIYLCDTPDIREELLAIEQRMARTGKFDKAGLCFQFFTLENFYENYENEQSKKEIINEDNHAMVQNAGV